MEYSALNPVVWSVFVAFVLVLVLVIGWFRKRYPDYPGPCPLAGEDLEWTEHR